MSSDLLLAPCAILLSALLAWVYHRNISIKRATLDLLYKEITDPVLMAARLEFATRSSGDGQGLLDLVNPDTEALKASASVTIHLNHCELVAIAVLNGALSERMYRDWRGKAYVKAWKRAAAFVTAKRNKLNHQTLYENFEQIAGKWE